MYYLTVIALALFSILIERIYRINMLSRRLKKITI